MSLANSYLQEYSHPETSNYTPRHRVHDLSPNHSQKTQKQNQNALSLIYIYICQHFFSFQVIYFFMHLFLLDRQQHTYTHTYVPFAGSLPKYQKRTQESLSCPMRMAGTKWIVTTCNLPACILAGAKTESGGRTQPRHFNVGCEHPKGWLNSPCLVSKEGKLVWVGLALLWNTNKQGNS